jgi:hypothetical protein
MRERLVLRSTIGTKKESSSFDMNINLLTY